jgi:predicted nucleotidyltransferase
MFVGVLLLGSLSRGESDAISDVDLIAVTHPGRWEEAWETRHFLSSEALVRFDLLEGRQAVAGHYWLTPSLVRVECLTS